LFPLDREMDGRTGRTKLIVIFRNFEKAPNNISEKTYGLDFIQPLKFEKYIPLQYL